MGRVKACQYVLIAEHIPTAPNFVRVAEHRFRSSNTLSLFSRPGQFRFSLNLLSRLSRSLISRLNQYLSSLYISSR